MAEHAPSTARRLAVSFGMGVSALAAAASLMTFGVGTASADDLVPDPSVAGNGREPDGAVRESATQGDVRSAGMGEAVSPAGSGDVRGSNKAAPGTKAWVFPGASGDISACVYSGPWCANWMAIPFDLNNP
ncbi:hypothetical protein Mycch_4232 [Mycolicibacterium chubuense NBB4]|uniref:Uncharacterized protein n=1 Tax=Mycolicibacterium chubuense (strain NBB4) TaxID=710421 RepID=I4BNU0_MYCCN|nr:hypothetical protein [Mycolicibacterium chubuense]AFM18947.1 hypothetical protein Mycch_4232 [Mycolicibacterium chubuense NBB4]